MKKNKEWQEMNARRCELIIQSLSRTLSVEEELELGHLQMRADMESKEGEYKSLNTLDTVGLVNFLKTKITDEFGGSQKQFADSFKFSVSFISDVLNGRKRPSKRLAQVLGFAKIIERRLLFTPIKSNVNSNKAGK